MVGGPLFYNIDDATAVLECYRSYIKEAPEQLGCFFGWQMAPPLPFISEDRVGDIFCVLVTCWSGPHEEAEQVLRPLHDVAEVQAELVEVMPFPALQNYGANYESLSEVKAAYDPDNIFHVNQNIAPAKSR